MPGCPGLNTWVSVNEPESIPGPTISSTRHRVPGSQLDGVQLYSKTRELHCGLKHSSVGAGDTLVAPRILKFQPTRPTTASGAALHVASSTRAQRQRKDRIPSHLIRSTSPSILIIANHHHHHHHLRHKPVKNPSSPAPPQAPPSLYFFLFFFLASSCSNAPPNIEICQRNKHFHARDITSLSF